MNVTKENLDFIINYHRGFDLVRLFYMNDESIEVLTINGEDQAGYESQITDELVKELIEAGGSNHGDWISEIIFK